ncbi:MAG TPA: nitrilase-related carbon-nitrogen hydrolase [Rhodothermales bacterium]|nr:nitrilase-related carbon-nitrogen hydrolase [Rhodothermales bacterium]
MKLALIQHQPTANLMHNVARGLAALEEAAAAGAQLVVYPELAFTPFYPQHQAGPDVLDLAEPIPGPTTDAFCEAARRLGVVVVLNLYEREGDCAFDTSPVIEADGTLLGRTRMMHITDYAGFYEQSYYAPGDTGAPVYETAVGRLGVAICYDRHYPEYLRMLALGGADLVVVPQAGALGEWPEGLFEAELRVSAFQNGYFMALANRVGQEDVLEFGGGSFVTDPFGQPVAQAPEGEEAILYADIDLLQCEQSPARQLFFQHRRPDQYVWELANGK